MVVGKWRESQSGGQGKNHRIQKRRRESRSEGGNREANLMKKNVFKQLSASADAAAAAAAAATASAAAATTAAKEHDVDSTTNFKKT